MPLSIKELIVILVIAAAVFKLSKPIALLFTSEADFSRRRNVWCLLTAIAFLSPSFWIFTALAIPILVVAGGKDSNPSALYMFLLHVIPPISAAVPMVGISYLFDIDNYLLLSFCVMVPAALRLLRSKDTDRIRGLQTMDLCLFAFGLLTALMFVHPLSESGTLIPNTPTDCMRRFFVFFFNIVVPYFVISRSSNSRRSILDLLAAFTLACALLAALAIFESVRHWLLYGEMADRWGLGIKFSLYVSRGESLRAMASSGHPLALGYLLAIAFGIWLYLRSHLTSKRSRLAVTALLWLGLLAAYSRGPWIGAVCIYLAFAALSPRAFSRLLKATGVGLIVALLISLSPLRDKVVSVLPFLGGTIDSQNVAYRQRLFDRSWQLIQQSPLFGDQDALLKLQDLRQGQGIIDIVNSYLQVLLNNGFAGLSLFLSFILIGTAKAWSMSKKAASVDPDFAMLGTALVACILGTLLMMENGSFGTSVERLYYALAGLTAAYAYLGGSQRTSPHDALSVAFGSGTAKNEANLMHSITKDRDGKNR
jgi:O-antigen ligase